MAQLTCKNLTLGYDNRAIQEDLNFSIDAGDYLCIVGENGSGKSTLMKSAARSNWETDLRKTRSDISHSRPWCRGIFRHQCGRSSCPDARAAADCDHFITKKKSVLRRKQWKK